MEGPGQLLEATSWLQGKDRGRILPARAVQVQECSSHIQGRAVSSRGWGPVATATSKGEGRGVGSQARFKESVSITVAGCPWAGTGKEM